MGGPSKGLWAMLAITVPIALLTLAVAVQTGRGLEVPAFQMATIVVGSIVVWRLGPQIVEGMTRIYTEATRIFGAEPRTSGVEPSLRNHGEFQERSILSPLSDSQVFCVHCGYPIPVYATFCRRCGKRQ